jgi:hypothetical protein
MKIFLVKIKGHFISHNKVSADLDDGSYKNRIYSKLPNGFASLKNILGHVSLALREKRLGLSY